MLNRQKGYICISSLIMGLMDDKYIDELIGYNLKRIIFDKNISQNKLAEMINVPPPLINQIIMHKKGMGKDIMARICNALKIEPYELFLTGKTPIIQYPIEEEYLNKMREAENLKVAEEIMHYAEYVVRKKRHEREDRPLQYVEKKIKRQKPA
jgi:transcriptional regulator with XRE-family HTH domain